MQIKSIIVFLIEFAMALMLSFLNDFSISDTKSTCNLKANEQSRYVNINLSNTYFN